MISKLPPVVQETLMMGAGAGLTVLSMNPTPENWHDAKHLIGMAAGAIIGAEIKAWRNVVMNWLGGNSSPQTQDPGGSNVTTTAKN